MKRPVELRMLLLSLVCVPLVFNLIFVFLMLHLLHSVDAARSKHIHSLALGTLYGDYASACLEGSTYAAFSRSKSMEDRRAWWGLNRKIETTKASVMHFVKDDDEVRSYLERFESLYRNSRRKMRHANRQMEAGRWQESVDERVSSFDQNNTTLQSMRPILMKEFESAEAEDIAERRKQDLMQGVIISFAVLSTGISGALMYLINRRIVRRSRHLGELVNKIAAGEELGERPEGDDDFTRTETALYDMAVTLSRAREREKAVFDNAIDVILQLDCDLKIMRINSACKSVWGYDEQLLLGRNILDLIAPQDKAAARTVLAGCLGSQAEKNFETRLKGVDGGVLYTAISASFSKDSNSLFCVAHDITERKTIELQREELLASVSHDVRTPMTSIQITLALFEKAVFGELPASCAADLKRAILNSNRSIDMISDFLDLEKIAARKSKPDIQVLDLGELIDEAVDSVELGLASKSLKVDKGSFEKTRVYVDKRQYTKVLRNLLKYCIDAAPDGSQISIKVQADSQPVIISMTCTGLCIPAALKKSMLRSPTGQRSAKTFDDSGLSFALVKKVVENHGNSIEFEIEESVSATFKIAMPGSQTG